MECKSEAGEHQQDHGRLWGGLLTGFSFSLSWASSLDVSFAVLSSSEIHASAGRLLKGAKEIQIFSVAVVENPAAILA